ncbi:MAG: septal junction protein FraD [Nostocaceae cyanobacterium]|nr:septal junction protein FraD [Nostocaceae cyanobacterium]
MELVKDLLGGVFKFLEDIFKGLQNLLSPPQAYSWQTLIYLSIFSWLMSFFARGFVTSIITFMGWLFLIAGTAWYTTDKPVMIPGTSMPVGSLITGALVSILAFGNENNPITAASFVLWPTISALITAIPEFFQGTGTNVKSQIPKLETRQKIIVLLASSILVSCWLNLLLVTDNWIKSYPSLLADDFNRQALVFRLEKPKTRIPRNGIVILQKLETRVEEEIRNRPWSEVEQWLIDPNLKTRLDQLAREVIDENLSQFKEKTLWRVEPRITNINNQKDEYRLDILSIWLGPSSNPQGYYLKKSCEIKPIAKNKVNLAKIECERVSDFIDGSPLPQY